MAAAVDTPFDEHAYVLAGYKQFLDNGQIKTSPIEEFYDVNWGVVLGKGGGGYVFRAIRRADNMPCAVKLFKRNFRTKREVFHAIRASESHLEFFVRVFDVFEATRAVPVGGVVQDALLMVMECVTGGDLFDYIVELRRVRRYMREEDARSLFRCVVLAIGALHGAHVAHRDIKPENIMLVRDPMTNEISFDTVRLIDFGWAKTIHPLVDSHTTEVGTPRNAAPEVLSGHYSFGVDMFSLGTVLHFMMVAAFPYVSWNQVEKLLMVGLDSLVKNEYPWSGRSAAVKRLVSALLHGSPAARPMCTAVLASDWFPGFPALPAIDFEGDENPLADVFLGAARINELIRGQDPGQSTVDVSVGK